MINKYIEELKICIDNFDVEEIRKIVDLIILKYKNNNQIFIIGNGGSAATASHFACDLGKGTNVEGKKRFKVFSLTDNIPIITAIGNDISYDDIFSEQLKNYVNENDLLIAISASGNSKNIVKTIEVAKGKNVDIVGFTGFSGGYLKENSDLNLHINSFNYGIVEDLHLSFEHMICQEIKRRLERD